MNSAQLPLPFAPVRRAFAAPVIEAASNAEARTWLARVADWPQGRLALWGPACSGKSRLLADWARRHNASLTTGPDLRFISNLEMRPEPVVIDDADRASSRALLHTLNAAQEVGLPVLLAAHAPPARWPVALPDLASRLRSITAVSIGPPEDDLLRALLARLLAERQLRPSETTLTWLQARLPRTHAAIAEAVERLDRAAQVLGTPIGPGLARLVLVDLLADIDDPNTPAMTHDTSVSASPGEGVLL